MENDDWDDKIMGDNSDNEEGMATVHHGPTSPITVNNCLHEQGSTMKGGRSTMNRVS